MAENSELFRQVVAAFNRGDLDAALEMFDPFVVMRLDPQWPENRPRFGIDEVRSFFVDLMSTLGRGESEVEELIDRGDLVVARIHVRFQGQASAIRDEAVFTQVATFRHGKVILLEYYLDFDEALRTLRVADR